MDLVARSPAARSCSAGGCCGTWLRAYAGRLTAHRLGNAPLAGGIGAETWSSDDRPGPGVPTAATMGRMTDASASDRELDLVLVRRHRLHRPTDRRVPRPPRARRPPLGAGRPQRGEARGRARAPRHDRPAPRRPAAAPRRRDRRRLPQGRRPPRPRRDHHGRALPQLRRAAGRGLRRGRHRLRRPHRRAGVRRPDVRRPPRHRRAHRRPARPRLRLRLDPARPRRLLHRPAAARRRADHAARRGALARHVLRRHLPLRDDPDVAGQADEAGVRGPPQGRAAPGGPLVARGRRQAAPRRGARPLAAAAADDRPDRRGPQRRRAPVVRPGVPLLPLRRHQDAALRRRRRRRRRARSVSRPR